MTQQPVDPLSDFRIFLKALWRCHGLPDPTLVQQDIAFYLQHGPAERVVMAERGEGKTWITVAFLLWRLYMNHNERVLLISESAVHARKSLKLARQWIDVIPFLTHLSPQHGKKQRDGVEQFDIGPAPKDRMASVTALGITGQITGNRGSLIIPDDIETDETVLTVNSRDQLKERIKEFENVRVPNSDVVVLGTAHHEDSVYKEFERIGYEIRHWPARYPKQHERTKHFAPTLSKMMEKDPGLEGTSCSPTRFDDVYYAEREIRVGKANFAQQYMLRTDLADSERCPLKLKDLIVYPCHRDMAPITIAWGQSDHNGPTKIDDVPNFGLPGDGCYRPIFVHEERERYHGTKMVIDPSGGEGKVQKNRSKQRHDETAWAVVSQLNGYLWLKEVGGYTGGHDQTNLMKIVSAAKRNGVNDIYIEKNFGGDILGQLIKPLLGRAFVGEGDHIHRDGWAARVETYARTKWDGGKEQRIISHLDPIMLQHRLVVDPSIIRDEKFCHQLTHITHRKGAIDHDDRVEVVSECVGFFMDVMDQDPTKQAQRLLDERGVEDFRSWDRRCQEEDAGEEQFITWAIPR